MRIEIWEKLGREYLEQEGWEEASEATLISSGFSELRDCGELYMDLNGFKFVLWIEQGEIVAYEPWDWNPDEPEPEGYNYDADGEALASMGWGTDENYGGYGEDDCYEGDW